MALSMYYEVCACSCWVLPEDLRCPANCCLCVCVLDVNTQCNRATGEKRHKSQLFLFGFHFWPKRHRFSLPTQINLIHTHAHSCARQAANLSAYKAAFAQANSDTHTHANTANSRERARAERERSLMLGSALAYLSCRNNCLNA